MPRFAWIAVVSCLVLVGACGDEAEEGPPAAERPQFVVEEGYEMNVDRGPREALVTFDIKVTNHGTPGAPTMICTLVYGDDHLHLEVEDPPTIEQHETATITGSAEVDTDISNADLEDLEPECDA